MPIKMSEVVKRSGVPKSTILYYIKEGLLPQPQKPKPNLHLYDESIVDRLHLISYLQKYFDTSIDEIKSILQSGAFDFSDGFRGIWETLDILMGTTYISTYSIEDVAQKLNIPKKQIDEYIQRELIYLRDGCLTDKEIEIIEILLFIDELTDNCSIVDSYVDSAKAIATKEVDTAQQLLKSVEEQKQNSTFKSLLDTTLILKQYIYNMQTLKSYQSTTNQEITKDTK
jgi:DNA-binding transcriptional MerR regulator